MCSSDLPWEPASTGFASRSDRVEHARATMPRRASNALGNVVSTRPPSEEGRVVSGRRDINGHTTFRINDTNIRIPSDVGLPELSRAYTQWANESHFEMQQMSGLMMGLAPSSDRPAFLPGNTTVNRIKQGYDWSDHREIGRAHV